MLQHTMPMLLLPLMAGRALSVAMHSVDSVLHTAAYLTDKGSAKESVLTLTYLR